VRSTIAAATRLTKATAALERRVRAVRARPDRDAVRRVNAVLMALGRTLIPVDYTRAGRFDHDPALAQPYPPHLAALRGLADAHGDEAKHLAVKAVRDLNAVRHALAAAADLAEAAARGTRAKHEPA
jgi:hypothetical protein